MSCQPLRSPGLLLPLVREWVPGSTHQSPHGAVQRMPVVPPELGVDALERGVALGLRLLDAVFRPLSAIGSFQSARTYRERVAVSS